MGSAQQHTQTHSTRTRAHAPARDALLCEELGPRVHALLAERGRERAQVRDDARRQRDVAHDVAHLRAEVLRELAPPRALAAEAAHQPLRAVQLVGAVHHLRDNTNVSNHWGIVMTGPGRQRREARRGG